MFTYFIYHEELIPFGQVTLKIFFTQILPFFPPKNFTENQAQTGEIGHFEQINSHLNIMIPNSR